MKAKLSRALSELMERMRQGVVFQDASGQIYAANPASERILGLSFDQMCGKTSLDPEWKAIREDGSELPGEEHPAMVALRSRQPVYGFIQGIYNPSLKHHVWMVVDSLPHLNDKSGEPEFVVSVFADITLRKKAEFAQKDAADRVETLLREARRSSAALLSVVEDQKLMENRLRETQSYLENLIEHANAPIIVWDGEFIIRRFNGAFAKLTGIPAATAIGSAVDIIFPETDKASLREFIQSSGAKRWENLELDVQAADGERRTLLWNSSPMLGEDGATITATIAQAQDITERKKAEYQSATLNERLQYLVKALKNLSSAQSMKEIGNHLTSSARELSKSDGATFILREDEQCHYVSENAIAGLWSGHRFEMRDCLSGWAIRNKTPAVIPDIYADERVPIRLYKSTFVKSVMMVPINTQSPIGAIGVYWKERHAASDMELKLVQTLADSAAKAIENLQLLATLEERVANRTAELEAANKELESFSYSVSHDLRAPLRAIDGYVGILTEEYQGQLDEEGRRICSVISGSARKMGKLIDDLLLFSRTGRASLSISRVDMASIVAGIIEEMLEPDRRARADIHVGSLPMAWGDPSLLRQVWINLIGNALKFSAKRERSEIWIDAVAEDGTCVYSVKDNGSGFNMEYADKLFGVFQRLHGQNEFDGTGVGLAIVHKIVTRHGGRVWAQAEVDKGATFFFSLGGEARDGIV